MSLDVHRCCHTRTSPPNSIFLSVYLPTWIVPSVPAPHQSPLETGSTVLLRGCALTICVCTDPALLFHVLSTHFPFETTRIKGTWVDGGGGQGVQVDWASVGTARHRRSTGQRQHAT